MRKRERERKRESVCVIEGAEINNTLVVAITHTTHTHALSLSHTHTCVCELATTNVLLISAPSIRDCSNTYMYAYTYMHLIHVYVCHSLLCTHLLAHTGNAYTHTYT